MKIFFGFGLALIVATSAWAQFGGSGALGGPFASRGIARPLGGIGPANPNLPRPRGGLYRGTGALGVYAFPYAYSTYVPNYFSSPDYDYWGQAPGYAAPGYGAPPAALPAPAPPVIINQYFGAPPDNPGPPPQQGAANGLNTYQAPSAAPPAANSPAGDPIGPAQNYYLIAYKDHSVYSVLAYWLEGDTLHYVTTQNTHNQASISLIDLDLTKTLNQARGVPFAIAGR